MGQGGGWISGDKKVPPGGAFLPSYSESLGGKCDYKIQGRNMSDEQDFTVFLLAQHKLPCWCDSLFFPSVSEFSKNLNAKSLDHSSIYIKMRQFNIFVVVYFVCPPWQLQTPLSFTLKPSISTFSVLWKTCWTEMTINSTRGPPPGDFTFLQRSKLKAN